MGAIAGTRNFQCDRYTQLATRLGEGLRIGAPVSIVEVHCEEVAAVIGQQRIYADGVVAGKMIVDRLVGQRDQPPLAAVRALDAWLLAHAGAPLVGTDRRVTTLAGFVLPAQRVDIGATTK